MPGVLEGKVALVTGASRVRGIGRATAGKLASLGAAVVVTDLASPREDLQSTAGLGDASQLEQAAADIEARGGRALAVPADVTSSAEVQTCVAAAVDAFGGLDIVVNNAGTPVGVGPFLELTDEQWRLSWEVNVMGAVNVCRAAVPVLRARGGGSIVNNASVAALGAVARFGGYCATKAALVMLTRVLALELGADGIRVNAVCPGMVDTEMGRAEVELIRAETEGASFDDVKRALAHDVPLGRWGTPEEVAEVVAFLAGPAAAYVNGAAVPVTGGLPPGL